MFVPLILVVCCRCLCAFGIIVHTKMGKKECTIYKVNMEIWKHRQFITKRENMKVAKNCRTPTTATEIIAQGKD